MPETEEPLWMWGILMAVLLTGIAFDLFAHRGDRAESNGGGAIWPSSRLAFGWSLGGSFCCRLGQGRADANLAAI